MIGKPGANGDHKSVIVATPHSFAWLNPYGGDWGTAANWTDTTLGTTATVAPGLVSAVSIAGDTGAGAYLNITGTGAAASLAVSANVLLWGTVAVGDTLSIASYGDLELDGARLSAGSLGAIGYGTVDVGDGSTLNVGGAVNMLYSTLIAADGSTVRAGALIGGSSVLAVDGNSSVEIGTAGGATLGAITFDRGQSAAFSGNIYGNVVVDGTLGVEAGSELSIDDYDPFHVGGTVSGAGTIVLSEGSSLSLGTADSAVVQFAGPNGSLMLATLHTGTISGFTYGDVISVQSVSGLSYTQTSATLATLTLRLGGTIVGSLTLAGNYAGEHFHLAVSANGAAVITLQAIGVAPPQPSVIVGTVGLDILTATAIDQMLTGLGGNDYLDAGKFTGIDFKDTSADLDGSTIEDFAIGDLIDFTDMKLSAVSLGYAPAAPVEASLAATDGTHSAVVAFTGSLPIGYFSAYSDGGTGTDVTFVAVSTDAYSFAAPLGGSFASAADWLDTGANIGIGTVATTPPSYGNAVTIAPSGAGPTNVTGSGDAASLTVSSDVVLWGSLTIGSRVPGVSGALAQSGILDLDGGADVTLIGTATIGGTVQVGGGSLLSAAALATMGGPDISGLPIILSVDGSSVQFGTTTGTVYAGIAIDATSSVEIGTRGHAAKGALTIDAAQSLELLGTVDGRLVVNGTLVGDDLVLTGFGGAAEAVSGAGSLQISAGSNLTLDGSDSAAIVFDDSSFQIYPDDFLVLNGALPTGAIAGFTSGDSIQLARTVTSAAYQQTSATAGTLDLFDGATSLGSLAFSGTYSQALFQVQLSNAGQISTITYSPAPFTATGTQVSSSNDSYTWITSGGDWSNAMNWADNGGPATAAPGADNAVTLGNANDPAPEIISGAGSAASLTVDGDFVVTGTIAVGGSLQDDGQLSLAASAHVTASSLTIGGGASLQISGVLDITAPASSGSLVDIDGNVVVAAGGNLQAVGQNDSILLAGTLAVDGTSRVELGAAGGAATAAGTVYETQNVNLVDGTIAAALVLDGALNVFDASTVQGFAGSVGSITGSGTIFVGGSLTLDAAASVPLSFQPRDVRVGATLELSGPLPTGALDNFAAGDVIRIDHPVTGATFTQTTPSAGTLTLTDGAATIGTLAMTGGFSSDLFQVDVAAATAFATVTLQAAPVAAGTAAASTGHDAYAWAGRSGGAWRTAANWTDTTTNSVPVTVPGNHNAVAIAGTTTPGAETVIGGSGSAASLAVTGSVLLTGTVGIVGNFSLAAEAGIAAHLALASGARVTAASALIAGTLEVGQGSVAKLGATTLSAGTLLALDGSTVQLSSLIGDGSGDIIAVDANSVMKIGTPGSAKAGTLTQQGGTTVALTGAIYGSVTVGGTIAVVAGGGLFIDMTGRAENDPYGTPTVNGGGLLSISEGSTLGLGVATNTRIAFSGPNATLQATVLPTGTLSGFTAGDQIELDRTVTGLSYVQTNASLATLTLTNGSTKVGTLKLAGNFAGVNEKFHLDVGADGNSAVISLQTIGIAATQPTLILGTAATDFLVAVHNGQTLTGLGGGDTLSGAAFVNLGFQDLTANLAGSTLQDFDPSDLIDFTDMNATKAHATYNNGVLTATDGTHAATLALNFLNTPSSGGGFAVATSASAHGTVFTWHN